jgi:hypothetical protein
MFAREAHDSPPLAALCGWYAKLNDVVRRLRCHRYYLSAETDGTSGSKRSYSRLTTA